MLEKLFAFGIPKQSALVWDAKSKCQHANGEVIQQKTAMSNVTCF
jgi:hypothetical protein